MTLSAQPRKLESGMAARCERRQSHEKIGLRGEASAQPSGAMRNRLGPRNQKEMTRRRVSRSDLPILNRRYHVQKQATLFLERSNTVVWFGPRFQQYPPGILRLGQ